MQRKYFNTVNTVKNNAVYRNALTGVSACLHVGGVYIHSTVCTKENGGSSDIVTIVG